MSIDYLTDDQIERFKTEWAIKNIIGTVATVIIVVAITWAVIGPLGKCIDQELGIYRQSINNR